MTPCAQAGWPGPGKGSSLPDEASEPWLWPPPGVRGARREGPASTKAPDPVALKVKPNKP